MKYLVYSSLILVVSSYSHPQDTVRHHVGGYCEGCEGIYEQMPKSLSWQTTIPDSGEPGELLEIEGTIYEMDGKTPAPNVILYVYHTDAKGYYSSAKGQTGWAKRHGHLRGWMKTDSTGKYKFRTIRPAPYPRASIPAHIHPVIKEPNMNEYFFDEYLFEGDPFLTKKERGKQEKRCGSGIITISKGNDGVWQGKRDIILGLNIPDYR